MPKGRLKRRWKCSFEVFKRHIVRRQQKESHSDRTSFCGTSNYLYQNYHFQSYLRDSGGYWSTPVFLLELLKHFWSWWRGVLWFMTLWNDLHVICMWGFLHFVKNDTKMTKINGWSTTHFKAIPNLTHNAAMQQTRLVPPGMSGVYEAVEAMGDVRWKHLETLHLLPGTSHGSFFNCFSCLEKHPKYHNLRQLENAAFRGFKVMEIHQTNGCFPGIHMFSRFLDRYRETCHGKISCFFCFNELSASFASSDSSGVPRLKIRGFCESTLARYLGNEIWGNTVDTWNPANQLIWWF